MYTRKDIVGEDEAATMVLNRAFRSIFIYRVAEALLSICMKRVLNGTEIVIKFR